MPELEIHNSVGTSWATFVLKLLELAGSEQLWQDVDPTVIKRQASSMNNKVKQEYSNLYFQSNYDAIEHMLLLRWKQTEKNTWI